MLSHHPHRHVVTTKWWRLVVFCLSLVLMTSSIAQAQDAGEAAASGDAGAAEGAATPPAAEADGATEGGAEDDSEEDVDTPTQPLDQPADRSVRGEPEQRLREISSKVEELKESTFNTKSRLLLLRESVLRRTIAGSQVVVIHRDSLGSQYNLVQVLYVLDRDRKLSRIDYEDNFSELNGQIVIDEKLIPGNHILTVKFVYKGAPFGIFRYMDGYTFTLESSYAFNAEEAKLHEITVESKEKGDFFTPYEERPTIQYKMQDHDINDGDSVDPSSESS